MNLIERYGEHQLQNIAKLSNSEDVFKIRAELQSSLLKFTSVYFKKLTGSPYIIPNPVGTTSHVIKIAQALTDVHEGRCKRLMIHVPPRAGKSFSVIFFIAWAMSINPRCNFIYSTYGHELSAKHTNVIRNIMQLEDYRVLFGIDLSKDTNAKYSFKTQDGGEVYGVGTNGAILGNGAGVRGCKDYFSGAEIIDDPQNPKKLFLSKKESNEIYDWFCYKALDRLNGLDYQPIIMICHRMGNHDLPERIIEKSDPKEWQRIIIPALYEYDNEFRSFYPEEYPVKILLDYKERYKYLFYTKMQQAPLSETNNLFPENNFVLLNKDPEFLFTFITADTAETSKTFNDPTVFGFFGVYQIPNIPDTYGLHWIDCVQIWVEPANLEQSFMKFYSKCCIHNTSPSFVAIEKKSTGVTLLSILKQYQGLNIIDINRTVASKDKLTRFISVQPYINKRLVSFSKEAEHTSMCIDHCIQICPDGSHARDDIMDVLYDAIKLGLMDKTIIQRFNKNSAKETKTTTITAIDNYNQHINILQTRAYS